MYKITFLVEKISLFVMLNLLMVSLFAQMPQKMSYQAVIRNSSEQLVANKKVGMRISILQNSETGTAVYTETQTPTTNANGLVSLEIGAGKSSNNFSAIDWSKGPFFIKTETDLNGGTNYTISGVSQLLSVPYAQHAKTVEIDKVDDADADPTNEIQTLSLSGTSLILSKNGGTVTLPSSGGGDNWGTQTAVTNATLEGNGSTASPLKIAQQGATAGQTLKWNGTAWAPGDDAKGTGLTLPYSESVSNPDYAFSISNSLGSSIKGESTSPFGTGVFGGNSSPTGYTFGVEGEATSPDGIGVYGYNVANSGIAFGVKGESFSPEGTGVFGYNSSMKGFNSGVKGESSSSDGVGVFGRNISPDGNAYGVKGESYSETGAGVYGKGRNYGVKGESSLPDGTGVSGDGQKYGIKGEASSQTGAGVYGTNSNTTGYNFGVMGVLNSTGGTAVYGENWAQSGNAYGIEGISSSPSGVGVYGGNGATTGNAYGVKGESTSSVGIGVYGSGNRAGVSGYSYDGDAVYGLSSYGYAGYFRGRLVTTEDVGIGTDNPEYKLDVAGAINLNKGFTGGAIFCNGREALWFNEEYFSWGYGGSWNFFGDKVYIGAVATDPGANMLVVNGAAAKPGGGTWSTWSDIRLKDIQGNYEKGLSEVVKLKPVKFNYKAGNACNLPSDQNYVGFIAQDVQKIFPEAVSEGKDGYLSLDANAINVALVNAIKELKAENDRLKADNKQFEDRLAKIEKLLGERK